MTIGAGMLIDAIPLAPPRVSLLTSVEVITDPDPHFANGLTWLPEACAPQTFESYEECVANCEEDPDCIAECSPPNYWWACPEGEGEEAGAAPDFVKRVQPPEDIEEYRPFDIWTGFRCSALQAAQGEEMARRGMRAMDAFQSFLIERELQLGNVAQTAGFPNAALDSGYESLGGSWGFVNGLGRLEQYLATCQPGQVGVIHARPYIVSLWVSGGLVIPEPNGRRLRTALGTIVVPGAGYVETDGEIAYATSMVRVFLGPARRLADQIVSQGLGAAEVDTSLNTVEVRFERSVAAIWDGCCHAAIGIDTNLAVGNSD